MGTSVRVLFVEDSADDVKLILSEFRHGGYEPIYKRIQTAQEMRDALLFGEWEIVISDYRMPGFNGTDALAILQESGQDLPFIIVSGTIGEVTAVEAMKAGVHDYVMKDSLARLMPAVRRELQEAGERRSRKLAEAALRESEARFRNMADSAPVLLWVSEPHGAYSYVNKQWLEFTGRSMEQELGQGWRQNIHPDDAQACKESYYRNVALQCPFQMQYRMRRHDGEWRWMLDNAAPRFHSDNTLAGYIGSVVDMTESKLAELERENARKENERLLEERAAAVVSQRAFFKDVLYSVTEGRLVLCDSWEQLPEPLALAYGPIVIKTETLSEVRRSSLEAGQALDLSQDRCDDLISAVGEATMNAIMHGGGGKALICAGDDRLQVWIEDQGKGIDITHLPRATLERGYTTASSFGHGFFMMLNLVDRLHLLTGPAGTTVVIEHFVEPPEPVWLETMLKRSAA